MKVKYCAYCGAKLGKCEGDHLSKYNTLKEAEENADYVYSYNNGDYEWKKGGVWHYCRIIDGYVWERKREIK